MTQYRRWFFIEAEASQQDAYEQLKAALRGELVSLVPSADFGTWPTITYEADDEMVDVSEWESLRERTMRLLQASMTVTIGEVQWKRSVEVGRVANGRITLVETWEPQQYVRYVPFDELPSMLPFMGSYGALDEDGYLAGRTYSVSRERVAGLVDFLQSAERCLPVVLLSPSRNGAPTKEHIEALKQRWQGLAHIIRLRDEAAVARLQQLLPRHSCFNGAMRLYWPGFSAEDSAGIHPFKRESEQDGIADEWFAQFAFRSTRLLGSNPVLEAVKRQRRDDYQRAGLAQRKGLEAIVERIAAQRDAQEFADYAESVEKDKEALLNEVESLRVEVARLEDENRQLRWRANRAWQESEQVDDQDGMGPAVYLSADARETFESFDAGEVAYWRNNVLAKLLEPGLRLQQSEIVRGPNSRKCYVYPRKRSNDGRRVVYFCDGDDIYVCELFAMGEHDTDYDALRSAGVDPEQYRDFRPIELKEVSE